MAFPTNLWRINPLNTNRDIVAKEVIGPVVIKGRAGQVYAAGVAVVARNDCDIGNGGGVGQREENNQNGEGE